MILEITSRFPQLALPIQLNISSTPEYMNAVLRGNPTLNPLIFPFSEFNTLTTVDTSAGTAEIPDSVGSATIKELIDWGKIRQKQTEYIAADGLSEIWRSRDSPLTERIIQAI